MNKATVLKSNRFLGIQLVDSGLITLSQLEAANTRLGALMAEKDLRPASLLKILIFEQQVLEERALLSYQIEHRSVAGISLAHYNIDYGALSGMDPDDMWATRTLPFDWVADIWFVASAYYLSPFARQFWAEKLQAEIVWYVAPIQEVESAIEALAPADAKARPTA